MMNGIVRVTDKPANLIDALRSELAKEARRLSDVLAGHRPSWIHWPKMSPPAEVMVVAPEYQALVGALEPLLRPHPLRTSRAS